MFEAGVFDREVDVLICSLVFDVVCTDTHSLEIIMSRALRSADNLPLQITLLVISLCIFAMSCLKCPKVAFLPIVYSCSRFLSASGLLVVQGSLGEHHYSVGSALLPVLDISQVHTNT